MQKLEAVLFSAERFSSTANYKVFEDAVPVLIEMGLVGKSQRRTRRPTENELDKLNFKIELMRVYSLAFQREPFSFIYAWINFDSLGTVSFLMDVLVTVSTGWWSSAELLVPKRIWLSFLKASRLQRVFNDFQVDW